MKVHLLYKLVEEFERERKEAAEFERRLTLSEICNQNRIEEHRQRMRKYGLPEDTSDSDFRDYMENRHRESEVRRAAMEVESALLKQLRDETEGDPHKEVAIMRDYCTTHPNSELGGSSLIGALRRAQLFGEAIEVARRQLQLHDRKSITRPGLRVLMLRQGISGMFLEKGDTQEGIRQLEKSIAEQNREGEDDLRDALLSHAYTRLGDAYQKSGAIPQARDAWKQALNLCKKYDDVNNVTDWFVVCMSTDYDRDREIVKRLKKTAEL